MSNHDATWLARCDDIEEMLLDHNSEERVIIDACLKWGVRRATVVEDIKRIKLSWAALHKSVKSEYRAKLLARIESHARLYKRHRAFGALATNDTLLARVTGLLEPEAPMQAVACELCQQQEQLIVEGLARLTTEEALEWERLYNKMHGVPTARLLEEGK